MLSAIVESFGRQLQLRSPYFSLIQASMFVPKRSRGSDLQNPSGPISKFVGITSNLYSKLRLPPPTLVPTFSDDSMYSTSTNRFRLGQSTKPWSSVAKKPPKNSDTRVQSCVAAAIPCCLCFRLVRLYRYHQKIQNRLVVKTLHTQCRWSYWESASKVVSVVPF